MSNAGTKDAIANREKIRLGNLAVVRAASKQIEIDERRAGDATTVLKVLDKDA